MKMHIFAPVSKILITIIKNRSNVSNENMCAYEPNQQEKVQLSSRKEREQVNRHSSQKKMHKYPNIYL